MNCGHNVPDFLSWVESLIPFHLMPAAKFLPVSPRMTTRPPVMYSQPWSPTPSTTAAAPLLRTAKRSPACERWAQREREGAERWAKRTLQINMLFDHKKN